MWQFVFVCWWDVPQIEIFLYDIWKLCYSNGLFYRREGPSVADKEASVGQLIKFFIDILQLYIRIKIRLIFCPIWAFSVILNTFLIFTALSENHQRFVGNRLAIQNIYKELYILYIYFKVCCKLLPPERLQTWKLQAEFFLDCRWVWNWQTVLERSSYSLQTFRGYRV